MAEFAPKEEEFENLKTKITAIIGKSTTPEFDDTLDFLITLLREKAFIQINHVSVTKVQKELTYLTKQLKKLNRFLDTDITGTTHQHLAFEIINKMDATGCKDPLFTLHANAQIVMEMCENTQNKIKGAKPDFTLIHMRQVVAEELARELKKMGVEPKKYRDGEYVNVLKSVLKMIPCTVRGVKLSTSIPSDLFKIACKAIDDFPTKEPYSLLDPD